MFGLALRRAPLPMGERKRIARILECCEDMAADKAVRAGEEDAAQGRVRPISEPARRMARRRRAGNGRRPTRELRRRPHYDAGEGQSISGASRHVMADPCEKTSPPSAK